MLKFCVCAFLSVAAVSASYDFEDADFNQLLFEDLRNDFDDSFEEPLRFRRDTDADAVADDDAAANNTDLLRNGCHHGMRRRERDFHCCRREKIDSTLIEALKEVKKQCIIEIRGYFEFEYTFDPFNCTQMLILRGQLICISECIARKYSLLDEHGQLRRDALLTQLRLQIGNVKWKADAVEVIVDRCLAEINPPHRPCIDTEEDVQDIKHPGPMKPMEKKCNLQPLQFAYCIWKAFFLGCPKELQIDTGKCKKIRERLGAGDKSYIHKIFLHHLHSQAEDKKDSI